MRVYLCACIGAYILTAYMPLNCVKEPPCYICFRLWVYDYVCLWVMCLWVRMHMLCIWVRKSVCVLFVCIVNSHLSMFKHCSQCVYKERMNRLFFNHNYADHCYYHYYHYHNQHGKNNKHQHCDNVYKHSDDDKTDDRKIMSLIIYKLYWWGSSWCSLEEKY